MQITFDTTNPSDLKILSALMGIAELKSAPAPAASAQPVVAENTGTTESVTPSLSAEVSGVSAGAGEVELAPVAPVKRRRTKPGIHDEVVEQEAAVEPEAVAEPVVEVEAAPEVEAKPLTLDEVRAALQQFTAANGVPAGIELLKGFNAGRISELDASLYGEFVARCGV